MLKQCQFDGELDKPTPTQTRTRRRLGEAQRVIKPNEQWKSEMAEDPHQTNGFFTRANFTFGPHSGFLRKVWRITKRTSAVLS